jgi:hypothetical protein
MIFLWIKLIFFFLKNSQKKKKIKIHKAELEEIK